MPSDTASLVSYLIAMISGVVGIAIVGVLVPIMVSLLPDTLAFGVQRRDWRPLAVVMGVAVGMGSVGLWSLSNAHGHGAPDPGFWSALLITSVLVVLPVAVGLAVPRVLKASIRRHRKAQDLRRPRSVPTGVTGSDARPAPVQRDRINAREAERLVLEWLQFLGLEDPQLTPFRRDGGVDVRSPSHVVQVKNFRTDLVPVTAVRELHGVADKEGRGAVFFSASGFTSDAVAFANEVGMPLLVFRTREGRLVGVNPAGNRLRRDGFATQASS